MMPLGISSAAAVRVGHAIGRRDPEGASRSGWTALAFGASAMSLAALTLLGFPHAIARLFTPESAIIAAAVPLLRVAAFFQLFDGLQITATGALRGAGDTRTPMLCHFAGYWILGLPLGAYLCFRESLGAVGSVDGFVSRADCDRSHPAVGSGAARRGAFAKAWRWPEPKNKWIAAAGVTME